MTHPVPWLTAFGSQSEKDEPEGLSLLYMDAMRGIRKPLDDARGYDA